MGAGLAEDLEEFGHEAETINSGVEKRVDINLTLSQYQERQ